MQQYQSKYDFKPFIIYLFLHSGDGRETIVCVKAEKGIYADALPGIIKAKPLAFFYLI